MVAMSMFAVFVKAGKRAHPTSDGRVDCGLSLIGREHILMGEAELRAWGDGVWPVCKNCQRRNHEQTTVG
jgi:hypothetical protein